MSIREELILKALAGDRQGWIRYDARRVYISYGLGGEKVGLEAVADGAVRVWFHRMLLGAFVPSRDTTIQPCDTGGETGTVDGGSVLADGALGDGPAIDPERALGDGRAVLT